MIDNSLYLSREQFVEFLKYDSTSPSGLRWIKSIATGKSFNRLVVKSGDVAGTLNSETGYWQVRFKRSTHRAHRVIYALQHGECFGIIDHINGDKTDNRVENLRIVTIDDNAKNKIHKSSNFIPYTHISEKLKRVQVTTVISGKRYCKTFPFSKAGKEDAMQNAKIYLESLLPYFIENGYTQRQIDHVKESLNDNYS